MILRLPVFFHRREADGLFMYCGLGLSKVLADFLQIVSNSQCVVVCLVVMQKTVSSVSCYCSFV